MVKPLPPAAVGRGAAFVWPVRVYYEDTDAGGVVYYANYLKFMERARTEWLRGRGFEQDRLRDDSGILFVVRSVGLELRRPARFNDALSVSCRPVALGRASLDVGQVVWRDAMELVRASVRLACVDAERFVPVAIPAPVRAAVESDLGDEL
ncbi:4-hydroxybenzoyl-CoA thioesterase family active site protein [Thioalkalivibrio nitratireducens DSM 14787]|uniref:4-hydroxybenzoyl-CoA thioesterase family active site protein n=1 Tax=Thioalkalivibrio nitratireducens (strain DSM 14787 / UNIQEM 213 / ALEN2) TaxID=1255043 RepID=L0DZI6_THIND|nr:tol-pal system-associated acyl-CoA thioesterase [Thioalkalivibrio nitratireducens]AGA35009.1 4-hydroxybenzoyl-CoA thioesterase family active site protein [Thioalkalivibrio nitratireducens DSM 14787]